jgi:light-regulated signal transduction histidine kinase (bacteriophytochrome)
MLVTDLLAYTSVVMERPAEIEVDTNAVLARVLGALQSTITETAAVVRATDLPALRMNEGHLAELFQQILQNAL